MPRLIRAISKFLCILFCAVTITAFANTPQTIVAVGTNGTILNSTDAVHWSKEIVPNPENSDLNQIAYGAGKFVAMSDKNTYISSNGINWQAGHDLTGTPWYLDRVHHYFFAWTHRHLFFSRDAEDWEQALFPAHGIGRISTIARGEHIYLATTLANIDQQSTGRLYDSPDGIVWHKVTNSPFDNVMVNSLIWANHQFLALGISGKTTDSNYSQVALTSPDGINWQRATIGNGYLTVLFSAAWGDNKYVAVGYNSVSLDGLIFVSNDGLHWQQTATFPANSSGSPIHVIWGNNEFIAVGIGGLILTSPDGVKWTQQTSNTTNTLMSVAINNSTDT